MTFAVEWQYDEVVQDCTAALELNPGYVKAILRRAQANEHLEKYDIALEGEGTPSLLNAVFAMCPAAVPLPDIRFTIQ